jgi:hypothetical protein
MIREGKKNNALQLKSGTILGLSGKLNNSGKVEPMEANKKLDYEAVIMSSMGLVVKIPKNVFIEKLKSKYMTKLASELDKGNQREEFLMTLIPKEKKRLELSVDEPHKEVSNWNMSQDEKEAVFFLRNKYRKVQEDAFKWKHRGEYW